MNTPLKITFPGNVITDAHNETVATINPGHREFAEYRELFKFAPELKDALEKIASKASADSEGEHPDKALNDIHTLARRALAIIIPNPARPLEGRTGDLRQTQQLVTP